MKQKLAVLLAVASLFISLSSCGSDGSSGASSGTNPPSSPNTAVKEMALVLSDSTVTLDGTAIASDAAGAVTLSNDIVYYQAGKGQEYGEGTQKDEHSTEEAAAHKVVTIRQPGTYRVSGSLSAGQLAVDLGEDAQKEPNAVVTLVLDGVDITCTVAPAVIFYRVFECDTDWVAYDNEEVDAYTGSSTMDTSAAGANIILADDSVNHINGSYVARIYKEGTTKKLHKYDGAFYSRMSMNISGESAGTGTLNIQAENEGLDSELHLTINSGIINIKAENDGVNTNEDGVSVTTINGGTIQINAGLGEEGDGIDSNGHLVINGGAVYTMANQRTPDGGIDADGDILINGGYLVAVGTRNDAVSDRSAQPLMELSFASTLPAGSVIEVTDPQNNTMVSFTTEKTAQAITFSSPQLQKNVAYTLKVDGVVQQYTGNSAGGFGGFGGFGGGFGDFGNFEGFGNFGGGQHPEGNGTFPEMPNMPNGFGGESFTPPNGMEMPNMKFPDGMQRPEGMPEWNGQGKPENGRFPGGMNMPADFPGQNPGNPFENQQPTGEGSTEFVITDMIHSFSGISDSVAETGKTKVTFSAQITVGEDGSVPVSDVQSSEGVDPSHVQISVADIPSEDYAASCLWSDGAEAIAKILPEEAGRYQLTISVTDDETYAGTSQFSFMIPETEKD